MLTIRQQWAYFTAIFVSALLVLFGLGSLIVLIWPAVSAGFLPTISYFPQLPLAEAREIPLYDAALEQKTARAPYPPLSDADVFREGDWIHIPSIDIHVPLVLSDSLQDGDVLRALQTGAALYPNGVLPGRLGNTFISAHSTGEPWKGSYRFAFLRLNELDDGALLHLDYHGTRYTYRINRTEIITPQPDSVVISDRPVPTVTLMACWPLWSTKQRMLVHGSLIHVTKLTSAPV
ncbi:MAG: hypothetical protein COT71_01425 [Candidatus Andersenbacteria bacterium CG10_big_fil_rev_8_21_14_0_10_54_11]|uniref:Sortase n=1 Tax=Candidatus Andersenbacteria bacterium CG10_big_fil_rev_8_21_14_0_10_54_11 TaxID=1974485 RepID=A0A2M6WZW9_9BACT|nr:MAG: hypothetical protein COT71_01425 [Candidatus Andersenbacteria bacterium CG10_big_fil_rev_8_21_14_0_10_54_11]